MFEFMKACDGQPRHNALMGNAATVRATAKTVQSILLHKGKAYAVLTTKALSFLNIAVTQTFFEKNKINAFWIGGKQFKRRLDAGQQHRSIVADFFYRLHGRLVTRFSA